MSGFTEDIIMRKMAEVELRDPLTLHQIMTYDLREYKERVRTQALHELNNKQ